MDDPSVRPIAFKMKYCAIMVMKPGNSPRIIAIFMYGLRILNLIRLSEYETDSTKDVLIKQLQMAMISVFLNILGKFRTFLSVRSFT
jgi:hypothetical protein